METIVFAGLGSVGSMYARTAVKARDVDCCAIVADPDSYISRPVEVNGERLEIRYIRSSEADRKADLVIIAVKWHHLDRTLEEIAPCVKEGTVILSLLNGVRSENVIRARFPEAVVPDAFCSGVDSNRTGRSVHMNRCGKIVFGAPEGERRDAIARTSALLARCSIPFEVSSDIRRQMWWKLMVNAGMNQVSAVTGLTYGEIRIDRETMDRMHRIQREVIAVARAQGIALDEGDISTWDGQLATLSAGGFSSTLQDVHARRKTEVELYGAEICRQGAALGVPTPENERIWHEIEAIERSYLA